MGMVRSNTPLKDKDMWRTPPEVFAMLAARYGPFHVDAAANGENHLCEFWFGPGGLREDALTGNWGALAVARVFCNPPYTLTAEFVAKASREVQVGNIRSATLLVPATTDVKWFHDYVWQVAGCTVDFSRGRIRFLRPDGTKAGVPTHGSMFVTFSAVK